MDTTVQAGADASVTAATELDAELRTALFDAVSSREGEWTGEAGTTTFKVSSMGSVVRELMFPGQEFEMTNMYSLDGNGMTMTHDCGNGNQPHMRAVAVEDGRIAFAPAGVSDIDETDASYMGSMTLVIVDEDHFEQHWTGITLDGAEDPDHSMVFAFERVR